MSTTFAPAQPKALVVLSGGQDSTTCLAWARRYFSGVQAISFDYGQTHARELASAAAVAALAGVEKHHVVKLGAILQGTSPLTNRNEKLELYQNFEQMEQVIGDRVEKTFVPMRNALFLTIAANYAICEGITHLITGVCEADNANYPDCRGEFVAAQQHAIQTALGLAAGFSVHAPLLQMSKADSARFMLMQGLDVYAWLAFSHTAYDGRYPPVGKDHASILRAHGFAEAGLPDPLVMRAAAEGHMTVPDHTMAGDEYLALIKHIEAHKQWLLDHHHTEVLQADSVAKAAPASKHVKGQA